ncbi:hypothetical protein PR003_g28521 [Phytophthora rubi]|uniref:RxLR effector protein n=1 Tax=Phytophthora rubi TaxID=129364 RepID=A0A6A3H6J6_9STRA|nr:hypothetical protein PR001_g29379 [Phytophthora rubi]KAE8964767.1 hypothetical protein PR002_g28877 [Phytophthora rubi]KAE9278458.1 hypothetical protein PR003_g28521 [Phytophthora rubi]
MRALTMFLVGVHCQLTYSTIIFNHTTYSSVEMTSNTPAATFSTTYLPETTGSCCPN